MVPSDPDAYQKWLEQKRAEYSGVDAKLESRIFAVSPTRALSGGYIPLAVTGAEGIEFLPSFIPPGEKMGVPPCIDCKPGCTLSHSNHFPVRWVGP